MNEQLRGEGHAVSHRLTCLLGTACLLIAASTSRAAVTTSGDVRPTPPSGGGNRSGELIIGEGTDDIDDHRLVGTMLINQGTSLTYNDGTIGDKDNAIGFVTVTGDGSLWRLQDELLIGNEGDADMVVDNGAFLDVLDDAFMGVAGTGRGALVLDGFSTRMEVEDDFTVGNSGRAELTMRNDVLLVTPDAWIGRLSGSFGVAVVTDQFTDWQIERTLIVGDAGDGLLEIRNGAEVNNASATIGRAAGGDGQVVIDGPQTTWRHASALIIGDAGTGSLEITGRGRLENPSATIADDASSRGRVTVSGAGSLWDTVGDVRVGRSGVAILRVEEQGLVRAGDMISVGASGTIFLAGGRVEADSIDNEGVISGDGRVSATLENMTGGEVRAELGLPLFFEESVTNAGKIEALDGEIEFLAAVSNLATTGQISARNGTLRFRRGLDNDGTLAATFGTSDVFGDIDNGITGSIVVAGDSGVTFYDEVNSAGSIVVLPEATAVFLDDLTFTANASLVAQINGLEAGETQPQIEVGGGASINGSLDVSLGGGFTPELGDSFVLLAAAGTVSGSFAATSLPDLPSGLAWDLQIDPSGVTLSVIEQLLAMSDFNGDGVIDDDDFLVWQGGFGQFSGNATHADGDANGDGLVDGTDFLSWQSDLGASSGGAGAAQAVPEPHALGLGLLLLAAAMTRFTVAELARSQTNR